MSGLSLSEIKINFSYTVFFLCTYTHNGTDKYFNRTSQAMPEAIRSWESHETDSTADAYRLDFQPCEAAFGLPASRTQTVNLCSHKPSSCESTLRRPQEINHGDTIFIFRLGCFLFLFEIHSHLTKMFQLKLNLTYKLELVILI